MSDPDQLSSELLSRVTAAADLQALDAERVRALGRHGSVTALLKTLGTMTPEER